MRHASLIAALGLSLLISALAIPATSMAADITVETAFGGFTRGNPAVLHPGDYILFQCSASCDNGTGGNGRATVQQTDGPAAVFNNVVQLSPCLGEGHQVRVGPFNAVGIYHYTAFCIGPPANEILASFAGTINVTNQVPAPATSLPVLYILAFLLLSSAIFMLVRRRRAAR